MIAAGRYSRQERLAGIGVAGQERLLGASVVIAGCGALGSAVAEALARAGVGRLRLIDRDVVELSNLQRQSLFTEADAARGAPKAVAAAERLRAIRSDLDVEARARDLGPSSAIELLAGADVIVDGTDNFATRFVLNDAAIRMQRPWVYGACVAGQGSFAVFRPGQSCLRCWLGEAPAPGTQPTCESAGVLGPLPLVIGGMQATEVIRLLVGAPPSFQGVVSVELWDRLQVRSALVDARRDPACRSCGTGELPALQEASGERAAVLCGRDAVQIAAAPGRAVDFAGLARRIESVVTPRLGDGVLAFESDGLAFTVFDDGRALVRGTGDPGRARAAVTRWLGG